MSTNRRIDFDDLRARADFRVVLAHYQLAPIGQGDQAKLPCPFHDDDRPSCSVNLGKGLWHCFAGCGAGNVLDFVHRMECRDGTAVSIRKAGERLAEICHLELKAPPGRQAGRRDAMETRTAPNTAEGPKRAATGPEAARSAVPVPEANRPLHFGLTLDPTH